MKSKKSITIVGAGYVGMSIGTLLSQKYKVTIFDIDKNKINLILKKNSPVNDSLINKFFSEKSLNIDATSNQSKAFKEADFIIVCTPTDFNEETKSFDTSIVDNVVKNVYKLNKDALIVIKSTIPIGYTEKLRKKYKTNNIVFSPEFLREGRALEDNLYPSRIIVSNESEKSLDFSKMLLEMAIPDKVDLVSMGSNEAEAVKLFSNSYLAMRVAFFNEVDSFALSKNLNAKDIITGISLDSRIGDYYNNPSFGYGGYCLPKDTKQLLANFDNVPQKIIESIISSNELRKKYIVKKINEISPSIIGIYRLVMKEGSDNFRVAAILDVMKDLNKENAEIVIYEPLIKEDNFQSFRVINNLREFKIISDIIVCNRKSSDLNDIKNKVFSRDIFNDN